MKSGLPLRVFDSHAAIFRFYCKASLGIMMTLILSLDAANFTRSFYRLLDGGDLSILGEDENKLHEIESAMFWDIKKKEESWTGSLDENKKADRMVGDKIFKSFKNYERNKKDDAPEYFSFKNDLFEFLYVAFLMRVVTRLITFMYILFNSFCHFRSHFQNDYIMLQT